MMTSTRRPGPFRLSVLLVATALGVAAAAIVPAIVSGSGPGSRAASVRLDNNVAPTPPMAWNGYNTYSINVTESIVKNEARALVDSGMKAAGYEYVNLDGGWDLMQRDAAGQLQPDPTKFPDGIKPLARYVHSLGLKFGIYTSIGTANCKNTAAGSYGHYQQDARTFASWGVDYVKVDWCEVPVQDFPGLTQPQIAEKLGTQMSQALHDTGRPMVFDYNVNGICPDDCADWSWGPRIANLWRVGQDLADSYAPLSRNFNNDVQLYAHAKPGAWNDPDMLQVGNGGMSPIEQQSQFSLWAELAAPLIAGNDLTTMSDATRDVLMNRDVIAVDQDPLGRQAYPVVSIGQHWVLTKPLADGDRAVVLFNQSDSSAQISTTVSQIGLGNGTGTSSGDYVVSNLWTHETTTTTGTIAAAVPAHGVVMYRVQPAR